ncbi:MAG: EF-hand domain-containing protein [Gammaproteobacteria bacterium]
MNHRNTVQITSAILLAMTAASAFATDPAVSAQGPVPFESFDADGNGYVTQEEFNTLRSERIRSRAEENRQFRNMGDAPAFSDLDADGDGKLNREEIQAHQRERQGERSEYREQKRMNNSGMGMGRGGMGGRK